MSTKAIHEALDYLENNPAADEAQDVCRRARQALADIERAVSFVMRTAAISYPPGPIERVTDAETLLCRIAREAAEAATACRTAPN